MLDPPEEIADQPRRDRQALRLRRPRIHVEADVISLERCALRRVNVAYELGHRDARAQSGQLARGAVVVAPAHVQHVVAADQHPHPAGVDVRRDVGAGKVTEVHRAVGVRHPGRNDCAGGPVNSALDEFQCVWSDRD